jgi:hypothetical protein
MAGQSSSKRHRNLSVPAILILAALMLSFLALGCSSAPRLTPVQATVTLDGKPVEFVHVCFWALEVSSDPARTGYGMGITDAEGKVTAKDLFGKEGLFPGRYKVTFSLYVTAQGKPISTNAKQDEVYGGARDIMPKKYQSQDTTDIQIEVPAKGLTTTFELKTK